MGIFDKAKDALSEHSEHVDTGIEKAGDLVDERTGGKYAEHVDTGQDFAATRSGSTRTASLTRSRAAGLTSPLSPRELRRFFRRCRA